MVDLDGVVAFDKVELLGRRTKDVVADQGPLGEMEGGSEVIQGPGVYSMGDLGSH